MGFSWKGLFRRPERRSFDVNRKVFSVVPTVKSGVTVNETTALGISAVYACVNKISTSIASLSLSVYKETNGSREIVTDHPVARLLKEPNENQTSFEFWEHIMCDALIHGQGFAYIERNEQSGRPERLIPIDATNMVKVTSKESNVTYYDHPVHERCHPDDLIVISSLKGKSPIRLHMENLGISIASTEYGAQFFGQGGNMSGVISTEKELSDDQYQRLKDSWQDSYHGLSNSHKTPLLEHGLKYQRVGMNPEEAQFLETRKFQVEEIARIYNTPTVLIQSDSAQTYNNVEQQQILFSSGTLTPWIEKAEQQLEKKLLGERYKSDHEIEFEMSGLMRADQKTRVEYWTKMLQHGVVTVNEVRKAENMTPIGNEGDIHLVQVNQIPLDSAPDYGKKLTELQSQKSE